MILCSFKLYLVFNISGNLKPFYYASVTFPNCVLIFLLGYFAFPLKISGLCVDNLGKKTS